MEQQLLKRVEKLEKEVGLLRLSQSIPLEVVRSFQGRGFVKTLQAGIPDPDGDYTTNSGFRQDISLSGDPQTISVPQFPTRFLQLDDGSGLYIPLHAYFEFGF